MKIRKTIGLALLIVVTAIFIYGFLCGPLFPFSPIKPGFAELNLTRCTIVYPKNTKISPEYGTVDDLIGETEQFHNLQFKKRIQIIVCATNEQCKRFSMTGGHACTIQTGTVIYIRPSIQETTYPPKITIERGSIILQPPVVETHRDLTGFLKHELSHAILYQNTSILKAIRIKRWLEEGLAVYFGNPHHYYHGSEFRTLAIDQGCFFNLLDEQAEPEGIPQDIKYYFMYGAFYEFMNYLIQTYGVDSVLTYTHEYIKAPGMEDPLFRSLFGINLENELERFQQHIRTQ